MKNIKKIAVGLLFAGLSIFTFASCDNKDNNTVSASDAGIKVVLTQNKQEVTADFKVTGVVNLDSKKYNVTWTSNNDYAVVGELEDNFYTINIRYTSNFNEVQNVKLTATITNSEDSSDSYTKEFEFTIPTFKLNTIEEYDAAAAKANVAVKGIVVAREEYSASYKNGSVYIQDISGKGGYYAYRVKADSQEAYDNDLAIGNTVVIMGGKSVYNGLREFDTSSSITYALISKGNNDQIKNTNVTNLIKGDGVTADYQNQLISFDNLEIVSIGDKDKNNRYNIEVCDPDNSDKKFTVRVNTYLTDKDGDAYKAYEALNLKAGMTISVKGLCGWNNGAQIYPLAADSITVGVTSTEKIAASTLVANASKLFPAKIYGVKTYTLPTTLEGDEYKDMKVEWTSSSENATIADGKVTTKLVTEDETVTLTCKATIGEKSATKTVTLNLVKEIQYDSHADYVSAEDGTNLTVKGVVTALNGKTVYIQDADGAYYVYLANANKEVKVGKEISISGEKTVYSGALEIKNASVLEIKDGTIVNPLDVTEEFTTAGFVNDDAKQALYVTFTGVVKSVSGQNVVVTVGSNDITVRAGSTSLVPSGIAAGQSVTIKGIKSIYNKATQIATTLLSDITLNLTDAEKINVELEAAASIFKTKYTASTEIDLAQAGKTYDNVKLSYVVKSGTGAVIENNKLKLTQGEEDLTVVITITAQNGTDEATKVTKDVTIVIAKPATITVGENQTATMEYKGTTTGNMAGSGNEADKVGLDASVFNVTTDKQKASNQCGLNRSGFIALYSKDGQGNKLTISCNDLAGYTVTIKSIKIELVSDSNTTNGKLNVNGTDIDKTSSMEIEINGNEVVIINTSTESKSAQIRIKSIEINYSVTATQAN